MHCTLTTQAAKSQDIHAEAACSVGSHFASHNPRGAEAGGTPGSLWSQPLQQGHPGPHLGSACKSEGRGTRKLPGSLCQLSATCTVKTIPWWSEGTSYAPVCALYILPCPWAPLKRAWLCLLHLPFRDLNTWLRFPCPWALSSPRLSSMSALPRFVWHLMCNVEVECVGEMSIPPFLTCQFFITCFPQTLRAASCQQHDTTVAGCISITTRAEVPFGTLLKSRLSPCWASSEVHTRVRSLLNAPHQPNLVAATPEQRRCLQLPPDLLLAMQVWAAKRHTQSLNIPMGCETPCSVPHR